MLVAAVELDEDESKVVKMEEMLLPSTPVADSCVPVKLCVAPLLVDQSIVLRSNAMVSERVPVASPKRKNWFRDT